MAFMAFRSAFRRHLIYGRSVISPYGPQAATDERRSLGLATTVTVVDLAETERTMGVVLRTLPFNAPRPVSFIILRMTNAAENPQYADY